MKQVNPQQRKWVALSVLLLFVMSGGIYRILKDSSQSPKSASNGMPQPQPGSLVQSSGNGTAPSASQSHLGAQDQPTPSAGSTISGSGVVGGGSSQGTTSHVEKSTPGGTTSSPIAMGTSSTIKSTVSTLGTSTTASTSIVQPPILGPLGPVGNNITLGSLGRLGTPASPSLLGTGASSSSGPSLNVGGTSSTASNSVSPGSLSTSTTSGGATSSTTSSPPSSPIAVASPAPAAPPKPENECFFVTYHHKPVPSHTDEETCSRHKNLLKLKHDRVNPQSVCVRVNNVPVHYLTVKGHTDELIIGSIAGPKAKVTVRYCTSKVTCPLLKDVKDDCNVPKDEFMEAIGGGAQGQNPLLGQWDPTAPSEKESDVMAKLDGEVKKELETNDDLNGRAPAGEMFKDWIADNETPACGTQQAANP